MYNLVHDPKVSLTPHWLYRKMRLEPQGVYIIWPMKVQVSSLLQSECGSCLLRTWSFCMRPVPTPVFFVFFFLQGAGCCILRHLGKRKSSCFLMLPSSFRKGFWSSDLFWEHNYMNFCILILALSTLKNTQQKTSHIFKKAKKTTSIRNTVQTERKVETSWKVQGHSPYIFAL